MKEVEKCSGSFVRKFVTVQLNDWSEERLACQGRALHA
jgi:hypothetical protein